MVISRNAIDIIRGRKTNEVNNDIFVENHIDTSPEFEIKWDEEWQCHLMTQALVILKKRIEHVTFQAFDLNVFKNMPAQDVADFLDISVNMVYVSKSRVTAQLKKIIVELTED